MSSFDRFDGALDAYLQRKKPIAQKPVAEASTIAAAAVPFVVNDPQALQNLPFVNGTWFQPGKAYTAQNTEAD